MSHRVSSLSHTADVGFRVESPTLEGLFEGAGWALVAALTDEDPAALSGGDDGLDADRGDDGAPGSERIEVARPDRERLLVAWLREILHRAMSQGRIPVEIDVELDAGGGLSAEVVWRPPEASPELVREIKGVTYHGLSIRETGSGWSARVVLDV